MTRNRGDKKKRDPSRYSLKKERNSLIKWKGTFIKKRGKKENGRNIGKIKQRKKRQRKKLKKKKKKKRNDREKKFNKERNLHKNLKIEGI